MNYIYTSCNPALLIVDHGHFQYNSISLGLTVGCLIESKITHAHNRNAYYSLP